MIDLQKIDFEKGDGLVPAIIQDAHTNKVLMLGYMNIEAVEKTLASKKVTFFSRSKNRLWTKGESSGHFLQLKHIALDCDGDTLLVQAIPAGPTCHTGTDTCFNAENDGEHFLFELEKVLADRKKNPKEGSYTNTLLNRGINKITQKVGEEAIELVIEAKDDNKDLFLNEGADFFYHLLVLLVHKGYRLEEIIQVLRKRHEQ